MNNIEDFKRLDIGVGIFVATFLLNTGRCPKAVQLCKEYLILLSNIDPKKQEELVKLFKTGIYKMIFTAYCRIPDYTNAVKYGKELRIIYRECGETVNEGILTMKLADICVRQYKYEEAKELYETTISIVKEASAKKVEAIACGNLGHLYHCLGEYAQAKEYHEKALTINEEIGNRKGEAVDFTNLGAVFQSLGEYAKAKECFEKALAMSTETGDRKGEARDRGNLGTVFQLLGEYAKARDYHKKALAIGMEINDQEQEAAAYGNLGTVSKTLGKYVQAKEYFEKALAIRMEIGDRRAEATDFGNLGHVFVCLGDYARAIEYLEKSVSIRREIGDRDGEASGYDNLGSIFRNLGENVKATEYHEKALAIRKEIGGRKGQALSYKNQAAIYESLGKYIQAKECHEKALAINMEIGDREGVALSYVKIGRVFTSLKEYLQAKEYYEKALAIITDVGLREGEAAVCTDLGTVFFLLGDLVMAEGYLEKSLSISKDIGDTSHEFQSCRIISAVKIGLRKIKEASYYLSASISKSEYLRGLLKDNDQLKISFSESHWLSFRAFIPIFCSSESANTALYVLELWRARALTDLMAAWYSLDIEHISTTLLSWDGIENIMTTESNCTCLYFSYYGNYVFLWVLTTSEIIHFRRETVNESNVHVGLKSDLDQFIAKSFRGFGILPEDSCEDRSLNNVEPKLNSPQEESFADLRLVEDNSEENQDPEPSLSLFYKLFIAPVADLLVEPEIIIVPDRDLYQVPFAALQDEDEKYLSENFRIRIVPSLTTLKLIQEISADYHSQTGALIVGDPVVGRVLYKGYIENKKPLPCARREAEMIGELLGIPPLLGVHATKQAVLQVIHSVSLIHFAAHGNAERGEIALSPVRFTNRIPEEEEYLLTMSDISQVQLRAKLVVLSCCHSGSGQIRAEGVIGIARAFLGSGARSVLVALWALEDSATEQLMRCFYEHLVRGESASESLHEAMKWMRCNGYSDVRQWAPFMLIGDNVKFEFGGKDERP